MAAAALASSSLCGYLPIRETRISDSATAAFTDRRLGTSFLPTWTLRIHRPMMSQESLGYHQKARPVSIRCEQSTKEGGGLDVWLGRLAMVGFAAAITVEIATGKGLLENFGLTEPLPTAALAVTALAGVVTAVFIFQSSSSN